MFFRLCNFIFGQSLALRIVIASLLFFSLPISAYFVSQIILDGERHFADQIRHIHDISNNRALNFELLFDKYEDIGTQIYNSIVHDDSRLINRKVINKRLDKLLTNLHLTGAFILDHNSGKWETHAKASLSQVDVPHEYFLDEALTRSFTTFLSIEPKTNKHMMFLAINSSQWQPQHSADLVLIAVDIDDFLLRVLNQQVGEIETNISLLTDDDIIFASTDKNLEQLALHHISSNRLSKIKESQQFGLLPLKQDNYEIDAMTDFYNTYELKNENAHKVAVITPISRSSLRLLISFNYQDVFKLRDNKIRSLVELFLFVTIVSGLLTWVIIHVLSYPLFHLKRKMQKVTSGDIEARYQIQPFGFEINQLGDIFNQSLEALKFSILHAEEEQQRNEALARELAIGRSVQESLLPQAIPDFQHMNIATSYLPAKEVSGDFYDVVSIGDRRTVFTIADGAGKGVSACFYSLSLRSLLRSAYSQFQSPSEMLRSANDLFCQDTEDSGQFATILTALYDANKKVLSYSNCGHLPGFLVRESGGIERLLQKGTLPLGVLPELSIHTTDVAICSGDYLILYTDGITEAQNNENMLFTEDRLINTIKRLQRESMQGAGNVAQTIIDAVNQFQNTNEQFDDITLLVVEFK